MKKRNIFLLVVMLVIGFAAVSTTLIINGVLDLGFNQDNFSVVFIEALLNGEESVDAKISEDKQTITFTSNKLTNINEEAILDFKVKNNSTQYGADVTITCTDVESEYVSVESEFAGKTLPTEEHTYMEAQEIKDGNITAKLTKAYVGEDTSVSLTCTINASPTEKDYVVDYQEIPYKNKALNGADPVIDKNLVPVLIAYDGTVTKADTEKEWYNYEEKKWANAVILVDYPSKEYKIGNTIKEEDIESYFVWVPRYKYQIFNEGNYTSTINGKPTESVAQEIKIEFESKEVEPSTGTKVGEWLTHPAFTNFDVNGLWIGKFETGYKGATSTSSAQVNANDSSKVIIKPNVYSWRNSAVSNMFKTAYNYNRELDSHMIKNTEWGAVAYLSHSKYGINTEIRINNNSSYLTGYSAEEGTDQSSYPGTSGTDATKTLPYNTSIGYKASTTGNITGIYDMSGGAWEYVAAYMPSSKDASGFTSTEFTTYSKYLDVYPSNSTITSYNNRILGDATGEMGPFYYYKDKDNSNRYHNAWYNDGTEFIYLSHPWFLRSGHCLHGSLASQYHFYGYTGSADGIFGSRLVLSPQ